MIHNSSEIFWLSILYLGKKKFLKVQILRFSSAPIKFTKFPMSLMKPHFIFPSKLASTFSMIIQYNDLLCTFLPQKLETLIKRSPLKSKFWDFRVFGQNSPKSLCHFLNTSQFLFKFCVILHCYDTTPLYFFWFKHDILLTTLAHQSANFQTCHCSH